MIALDSALLSKLFGKRAREDGIPRPPMEDAAVVPLGEAGDLLVALRSIEHSFEELEKISPDLAGRKALAKAVAAISAMGAGVTGYCAEIHLGETSSSTLLQSVLGGLMGEQRTASTSMFGLEVISDASTTRVAITAIALTPCGLWLPRSGACLGDELWVSGTVGDAELGRLALDGQGPPLSTAQRHDVIARFAAAPCRRELAITLPEIATAAIDVSNGLTSAVEALESASKLTADVDWSRAPFSPTSLAAISQDVGLMKRLLGGADDHEILFTVPPGVDPEQHCVDRLCRLTRIGTMKPKQIVQVTSDSAGMS
ncbi:MAG: hypothetical protein RLQ25_11750 [Alphaproteobacteria bacterium]